MEQIESNSTDSRMQALIEAAYVEITKKGFEGLRVRDIAKVVGINPATMYYYFQTKEDLIAAVSLYVFQRLSVTGGELPGTPKEQLHSHLTRLYHQMRDEPQLFAVLTEIRLRSGRLGAKMDYEQFENGWQAKLVKLLETGIRQGYWPNYFEPEAIATTIIAMMQGAGMHASTQPRKIEEIINQLEKWLARR